MAIEWMDWDSGRGSSGTFRGFRIRIEQAKWCAWAVTIYDHSPAEELEFSGGDSLTDAKATAERWLRQHYTAVRDEASRALRALEVRDG